MVIAHRINTVIDSDLILVFHSGRCAEQGAPDELLADPASRFSAMVGEAEAGKSAAAKARSPNVSNPNSYSNLPLLVNGGGASFSLPESS